MRRELEAESPDTDEFDLLKSISNRLSTLEHNFYRITKEHKSIQKELQSKVNETVDFQSFKFGILQDVREQMGLGGNRESLKSKKGRVKSEVYQEEMQEGERADIVKIQEDVLRVKQDATEAYKMASRALRQIEGINNGGLVESIEQHCNRLLEVSMNDVMKIIKKYIQDQSIIKLDIQTLKDQVNNKGFIGDKGSPKSTKMKRTASASKTTDKKPSSKGESKWEGVSQKKIESERDRIMTHTDGNKSGKSFQKINDLKEKLKQFQMINDKYKSGKKDKDQGRDKQRDSEVSRSKKIEKEYQKSEKKSVEFEKMKKDGAQVIDQLKKFKHILENTESEIDISSPIPTESNPIPDYSKFHHLSKLYSASK